MPDLSSIVHDTIHVEHRIRCAPSAAFAAYADVSARAVWTVPSDDEVINFASCDFRVDGTDVFRCGPKQNPTFDGRTTYLDIVNDERIIATECISQSGMLLAASIITWKFTPDGGEVIVAVTDQVTSLVGDGMIAGYRVGYGRALVNLANHLHDRNEDVMTRLFHQMLVSADGFIAGPNGEFDWHTVDDDFSHYIDEMLRSIDMIVMGRVTYEGLSQYWPTAQEPEAPLMNSLPKTVFSRVLTGPSTWTNTTLTAEDPVSTIEAMKQTSLRQIGLFASAQLAATLTDADLIDEYRLLIAPVFLGSGKRLFPQLEHRHSLRLVHSEHFESGMACLRYEPLGRWADRA